MIPLRDTRTSGRFPIVTVALILINVYVFYLELISPNLELFFERYALIPRLVDWSNLASLGPFVTSMFLHGGIFHLASNMLFLWIFGDNVENRFGGWFLPFYLAGGTVGALLQYWLMPGSVIPMVGASGAIAAVLGAYFVLFPHHTVKTLIPILFFFTILEIPAIVMLGYWFLMQLFNGLGAVAATSATQGGVAYYAHVGGFITGAIIGRLLKR